MPHYATYRLPETKMIHLKLYDLKPGDGKHHNRKDALKVAKAFRESKPPDTKEYGYRTVRYATVVKHHDKRFPKGEDMYGVYIRVEYPKI